MKYVFIQSTKTINVTTGLQLQNKTNPNLPVKDNFKIKPVWPSMIVQLLEGRHLYPAIVATFKSVKSLKDAKIVTIGEYVDEIPETENSIRIKGIEKKLRPLITEFETKQAKKTSKKKEIITEEKTEEVESEE